MHAPTNAPVILDIIFLIKYFDKNPINKTEPHVNRAVPWKPINKSVLLDFSAAMKIDFTPKFVPLCHSQNER